MIKNIGVLTSGGDCAGLNAAIRAITYHATQNYGWKVTGILQGTTGLICRPLSYKNLTMDMCDHHMLRSGGTILGSSSKDDPFRFPNPDGNYSDRSLDFVDGFRSLQLDALIGIGGDGSMKILHKLSKIGNINFVGVPKTIDNDLPHTNSIGHSTAMAVASEALDRLYSTAASHNRVIILEVMGRDAGHIALAAGIAGGADIILIPEIPYKLKKIYEKIRNKASALVIMAESVKTENNQPVIIGHSQSGSPRYGGIGQYLSEKIQEYTSYETRCTVLGHVQRGCMPGANDRILASILGVAAVDLVKSQKFDHMVTWNNGNISSVPIQEATQHYRSVAHDDILVKTAQGLGIYIGELGA